ncbi:phosphoheptose isomerase [Candidatus Pelagibacter sp.]|nr:phosphoheptose isomerase [Candidatus Pelagibacter sp.]
MKLKTICFDIDNVICRTNDKNDYLKSKPIKQNIKLINKIYNKGYRIILYTARYMGRCNGNLAQVKKKIKPLTLKQLDQWGVNYHKIYFGKPSFDLFIDDKSLFFSKKWQSPLKKKLKI